MPELEFEFNQKDKDLVISETNGQFSDNDYIRLTIYPTEAITNVVDLPNSEKGIDGKAIFFSTLNPNSMVINISPFTENNVYREKPIGGNLYGGDKGDFKIYKKDISDSSSEIYIKPNEIFNKFELPQGDYKIQIDFLNQVSAGQLFEQELPTPYWFEDFDYNGSGFLNIEDSAGWVSVNRQDIAELIPAIIGGSIPEPPKYTDWQLQNPPDTGPDGETVDNTPPSPPPLGVEYYYSEPENVQYKFIIKQISTSRKEVRLKILNEPILNNSDVITKLTNEFNNNEPEFLTEVDEQGNFLPNPNYKYQFGHILSVGNGDHNPIMNYTFDRVTDGKDNQSIILKLYDALPTNISNLSFVTIEREVLTTQVQDIFYFSEVPDVFFGDGLKPDQQENWLTPINNEIGFENFDDLINSSSIEDITSDTLISASSYGYPNLNTDFNEFTNHTFFGSAKKKLENFKTKVETIQSYYSEISSSLSTDGISLTGDSTFVIQKRKDLFNKISEEFKTFTPYERFLYFDGQTDSTSSAPALKNYADNNPLKQDGNYEELNQSDGFNVVYKNSNLELGEDIHLTDTLYRIQNKPFFNHSGSVYLSFLLKGTNNLEISRQISNNLVTGFISNGFFLPHDTAHTASILEPTVISSSYKRFIYEASQSYFIPKTNGNDMADLSIDTGDFNAGSTKIEILSGSVKTGSSQIKDSTNLYPTTVITQSGVPFKGSVMPAGDLFTLKITSGSALTQSFITDVKVTLKNPTNVLPFDNIYKTTSTEFTDWYNNALTQAETFDTNNIHSFENNLPLYIQNSSDFNDMKKFLNLQGEQYDLIRNHIDSMGTIHKRGYKKTNSPPDNTLPMLLNNMGYQAINPFGGSLTETLGSYLSGVTSIDDIKNNTWRKTLNNLLYIYKSKGTKNSIRGLLNVYGYPPDVINFQEFGGSTTNDLNDSLNDNLPDDTGVDINLDAITGSVSYIDNKKKLYYYNFNNNTDRILNLDWWMDGANINTVEFVYKHVKTTQEQTILKSSGSGAETLWDVRLIPSSDGLSSSFEFRLNNSQEADTAIGSRGFSMSLAFNQMTDGQLWNVMLQRMTGSTSGPGTIEYRLHSALQNNKIIKPHSVVTMSISGGLVGNSSTEGGKGFFANQNFQSSGSRHPLSSSNLFVGEIFSGSLAEIKAWSTTLSTSKFKQHTLNKFSTVGNTIDSFKTDLVYRFKLNENYSSASVSSSAQNLQLIDSSPPKLFGDYSITKPGTFFTSSIIYGFDIVDVVKVITQDNQDNANDNKILINPNIQSIGNNLNSDIVDNINNNQKPEVITSPKLELFSSPQNFVNNFILDNLGGFNFEKLYGNPNDYYSQFYNEFDTFRENFFKENPIEINTNKFIRAYENLYDVSLVEGLKKLVPARSTFSDRNANVGVQIKNTLLEKQKYENEEHSVEVNPNAPIGNYNLDIKLNNIVFNKETLTELLTEKEGTAEITPSTIGSIEVIHSDTISLGNAYVTSSGYLAPFSGSTLASESNQSVKNNFHPPFLQPGGYVVTIENPLSASMSPLPTYDGSTIVLSKNGTIDYASNVNKSYVDVHKNWGRTNNDVQHINFAAPTGSDGTFNTYDIEKRFVFHSIGDMEYYSASFGDSSDFSNSDKFYNRLLIDNDFHANVNYESLINGNPGNQTGRMMGKTRYFITSSDGSITFPSNHVTNFSQPFKEQMNKGTQNTNPGFLNVRYEDYSTASFYRVNVTGGENQIIIKGGSGDIDGDDKIIYAP